MKPSPRFDYLFLAVGLAALWQLGHWAFGPDVLSSPAATVARAAQMVVSQAFWLHARATAAAFALAVVIAVGLGIAIGLWLGLSRFAGDVADPILGSLYSIPKITLYPLILLVFGLGMAAKVAFGVIHGVFPIAIFTMNAVRNVPPIYERTARILGLAPARTALTIMAPAALPEIVAGIRVGAALTLLGTLIGELFASDRGVGFILIRAMEAHQVVDIMALTLLLFAFAAGANALLLAVEHRVHRR